MTTRLLKEGQVVWGGRGLAYEDACYLNEGVTSEVYKACRTSDQKIVALKVLRPGLPEQITDDYWRECETLGALAQAEERQGDGIRSVPRLLESKRGDPSYIAMEWAPGASLEKLLDEGQCLEEGEALLVAERVLRVLHCLHEAVRRTYDDLQLKNIFLDRDADRKSSKVMVVDWNTLGTQVPEGQPLPPEFGQADLARLGAYLYRMLTGKGADERGEPEAFLAKRGGSRWKEVSRGTQQLVLRALHPNPARRFASARTFREAVQAQQHLWGKAWYELLQQVKEGLAREALDSATVEQLLVLLDMAVHVGAQDGQVAYYRRQLDEHVGEVSVRWQAGQRYFSAEQYREAAEKWEAEAEAQGVAALHRYALLAQVGVELGVARFGAVHATLAQVVKRLEDGQGKLAAETLEDAIAKEDYERSPAVRALAEEAQVQRLLAEADDQERSDEATAYERAAALIREAAERLANVPYGARLAAEQGWERLEERAARDRERAREQRLVEEVAGMLQVDNLTSFATVRDRFAHALRRDPHHRGVLKVGLDAARRLREADRASEALELLAQCLLFGHVEELQEPLRAEWHRTRKLAIEQASHNEALTALRVKCGIEKNTLQQQHDKEMEALSEEFESRKELLQSNHASVLSTLETQLARELEAKKEELRAQHEADLGQFDMALRLERARTFLETGCWADFLEVALHLPTTVLIDPSRWGGLVEQLLQAFNQAVDYEVGAMARPLIDVLALLDPEGVRDRAQKYDAMAKGLAAELRGLNVTIRNAILRREAEAGTLQQRQTLLQTLEFLVKHVEPSEGLHSFLCKHHDILAATLAHESVQVGTNAGDVDELDALQSVLADEKSQMPTGAPTDTIKLPVEDEDIRTIDFVSPILPVDTLVASPSSAGGSGRVPTEQSGQEGSSPPNEVAMTHGGRPVIEANVGEILAQADDPGVVERDEVKTKAKSPLQAGKWAPTESIQQTDKAQSGSDKSPEQLSVLQAQELADEKERQKLSDYLQDTRTHLNTLTADSIRRARFSLEEAKKIAEQVLPAPRQRKELESLGLLLDAVSEIGHSQVGIALGAVSEQANKFLTRTDNTIINRAKLLDTAIVDWLEEARSTFKKARAAKGVSDLRRSRTYASLAYDFTQIIDVVLRHLWSTYLHSDVRFAELEALQQDIVRFLQSLGTAPTSGVSFDDRHTTASSRLRI